MRVKAAPSHDDSGKLFKGGILPLTLAPAEVWANLEPAGGGVDFNPRKISIITQRSGKR